MRLAEEIVDKSAAATLARAVLAGTLITLLSYMVEAVDSVTARILVAYLVGFFLALGRSITSSSRPCTSSSASGFQTPSATPIF